MLLLAKTGMSWMNESDYRANRLLTLILVQCIVKRHRCFRPINQQKQHITMHTNASSANSDFSFQQEMANYNPQHS